MKLLEKLPLRTAPWLLWEYMPDDHDDDYTLKELLDYDPRGPFADNLNDMGKAAAVTALSRIIGKLVTPAHYQEMPPEEADKLTKEQTWWTKDREPYMRRLIEEEEREWDEYREHREMRGLNGSYDEYIDEHSDADPGL